MKNKQPLWIVFVAVAIIAAGTIIVAASNKPAPLDGFASCLKDKGAT